MDYTPINTVKIVIGSWGSYNACNEKSLGSKWLDLYNYESWEEIEEELKKEGFDLKGIDEELFIQDIEGIDTKEMNCDYMHPQRLFELIKESEILEDTYKFDIMEAFLEVRSFDEFENRVNSYGSNWTDDIYLYRNMDWYDIGYEFLHECHQIPDFLDNYIDYEKFGEELKYDGYEEYSNGIIEIR